MGIIVASMNEDFDERPRLEIINLPEGEIRQYGQAHTKRSLTSLPDGVFLAYMGIKPEETFAL